MGGNGGSGAAVGFFLSGCVNRVSGKRGLELAAGRNVTTNRSLSALALITFLRLGVSVDLCNPH